MHLNKGYLGKKHHFITKVNHSIVHLPYYDALNLMFLRNKKKLKMLISHQIALLQVHTKQKMIGLNKSTLKGEIKNENQGE